ncbi:hypothetical protein AKJ09_04016 [Labilithrix luteola]|uniref:Uncharacterized protein n=1 Tax=Labilithrix luteola TaxID=1391654 RepID=A0A0K1PV03_9BACT|nr:hypothetical protein [Labilithrix luteola]AKU97352.1 hypothetical protein AKJ09_04016 [Labilithrix luteola]
MLKRPAHIPAAVTQAPLTFPWSNEIAMRLDDFDGVPPRLGRALAKVNYKGKMAFALGCLEWVVWRLSGFTDVQDALQRIEAAWASQVSEAYARSLDLDSVRDDLTEPGDPAGPLQEALIHLEMLHLMYLKGKPEMTTKAGLCALLAFHVLPSDSGFEAWLEKTLIAMAVTDPCGPDFDRDAIRFDYSGEAAVPRAWLDDLSVPREPAAAAADWNAFFTAADPASNPFLVPADEMRAQGFPGEPYVFA